jgi:very-short-patch-repair endonuclease
VPAHETGEAAHTRAERRAYLAERGYRVCEVRAEDVEREVSKVLDELSVVVPGKRSEASDP